MWYVFNNGQNNVYTKTEPEQPYFTVNIQDVRPVKDGFNAVLKADFEKQIAWYELELNPSYVAPVAIEDALIEQLLDTEYRLTILELGVI